MWKNAIKALIADLALLTLAFLVIQNLQSRAAYAATPRAACESLCSSYFSHGILTQFLSLTENGGTLVSPPSLDWLQVLSLALVVVNVWFVYRFYVNRREAMASKSSTSP